MVKYERPACEWVGLAEDGQEVVYCARPAIASVEDPSGAVHHACAEHLASMKARSPRGKFQLRGTRAPYRPYPESIP